MATGLIEGIGVTVGFGTSSVTLNLLDVNKGASTVEDIATFDQGTTGYKTYIGSTLKEGSTADLTVNWNARDHNALEGTLGVVQTITVTLPKVVSTDTTAPAYAFSGYVNSVEGPGATIGELVSGTINIKVAGTPTWTDGAV